ncbi:MAG: hypothetical protein EA345_10675, partial [Halomonas sp.]
MGTSTKPRHRSALLPRVRFAYHALQKTHPSSQACLLVARGNEEREFSERFRHPRKAAERRP